MVRCAAPKISNLRNWDRVIDKLTTNGEGEHFVVPSESGIIRERNRVRADRIGALVGRAEVVSNKSTYRPITLGKSGVYTTY
jgi:hypothetical protein